MKKKFLGGIAVLAIAAVAAINVSLGTKSDNLSEVSLANVEALAQESMGSCWIDTNSWYCGSGGMNYCSPCNTQF
jgi:hypothetical protein